MKVKSFAANDHLLSTWDTNEEIPAQLSRCFQQGSERGDALQERFRMLE
jgi:hypothetical protein